VSDKVLARTPRNDPIYEDNEEYPYEDPDENLPNFDSRGLPRLGI